MNGIRQEDWTANGEKMKPQTVVGIDGSWNHRMNGSVHILDMVDVRNGMMVGLEIIDAETASRCETYHRSSHVM
jgi:hypothetical protein